MEISLAQVLFPLPCWPQKIVTGEMAIFPVFLIGPMLRISIVLKDLYHLNVDEGIKMLILMT